MSKGLKKVHDAVTPRLEAMVKRADKTEALMNRVIFPMYQEAQRERFATSNTSEGAQWSRLNPDYASRKKVLFKSYPEGGSRIMMATGALFYATAERPFKMIRNRQMIVTVDPKQTNPETGQNTYEYAKHAAEVRPIMKFGEDTLQKMKNAVKKHVSKGE